MDGSIVGDQNQEINPAGFVIHSAIHMTRPDVRCVMHTHTLAGMAIAALETGLSRDYLARLAREGRVPARRLSVGWVFDLEALRAFLADRTADRNCAISQG